MVGHPSLDIIPKPILLGAIPVGLAANGAALGCVFGSTKLIYNYVLDLETNIEKDILLPITIGAGTGFAIGLSIIGASLFDNTEQTDSTGFPILVP